MSTIENSTHDSLGSAIQRRRTALGWSLRGLAERSGVSAAMLSDVERGTKSPTVRLAYQIARALEVSITSLLDDGATPGEEAQPRPGRVLDEPGSGVRRTSFGGALLHGRLEVVVYELEAGASTGPMDPNRRGTVETVVCLDGEVEVLLDGVARRLRAGEGLDHGVHETGYRHAGTAQPARLLVLVDTSRT